MKTSLKFLIFIVFIFSSLSGYAITINMSTNVTPFGTWFWSMGDGIDTYPFVYDMTGAYLSNLSVSAPFTLGKFGNAINGTAYYSESNSNSADTFGLKSFGF